MSDKIRQDFNQWIVYVICLVISLVFMFFFGLNSPIHTFNSHCDYQWFLTMGRGMLAGKVPYRDLFEQKGPLTYVLFAFAALFPNSQFVIWCCEVLCISLFLYFSYRIARKFLSPWLSLSVLPIVMMTLSANCWRGLEGSCVEEYCLPIFAYGLLCFLDFIMDHRGVTWQRSLAIGICLGILLWVKFTMWEFFFVPMLVWLIVNLVHHNFVEVMKAGLIMIGGVLIITIPVLIGFAIVGGLDDLFRVYFYLNFMYYHPREKICYFVFTNGYFFVMLIIGVIAFTVRYWKQKSGWMMFLSVVFSVVLIECMGSIIYYYIPMFTYSVLGAIYVVKYVSTVMCSLDVTIVKKWKKILSLGIVFLAGFLLALPFVTNITEINRPREDYAPIVVADIIDEYNQTTSQPATLFCYRMADSGFYNAANIIPNTYYYASNTFSQSELPEMYASFDETISNQSCDFVVTYLYIYLGKKDFINTYYHPYFSDIASSTLTFNFYEPGGYGHNEIVILFRN